MQTTCKQPEVAADWAIRVTSLGKTYTIHSSRQLLTAQPLKIIMGNRNGQKLHALQDLSFTVKKGEIFGIIGHNGSGKSTLLKVLSGVTRQDVGQFEISGRLTSLLELGAGFQPELSGRENLYLYGKLVGLPSDHIAENEQSIIDFSGIETFIDQPVKTYSSGMMIRLAFATAIHTDPDILLLDEVLGVGDVEFIHRSFQAIQQAVTRGVTVVIVSHGLSFIGSFCSRVMCLHQGKMAAIGVPEEVINTYMELISDREMVCELKHGALHLRFLPGGFHIDYKNSMYTVVRGISVNLRKWEAEFSSAEAAFSVINLTENEVTLQLRWGHWNLEQIWQVRIIDDQTILWKIENGPSLHKAVDSVELEFMVSSGFNDYILPEEIRVFPRTITRGFNQEYLLADQHARKFIGVTSDRNGRNSLVADFSENKNCGSTAVISGGSLLPAQTLRRAYPADIDLKSITTKIHLFDNAALHDFRTDPANIPALRCDQWMVAFQNQKIHLFWKGQQITSGDGMFIRWSKEGFSQSDYELIHTEDQFTIRETNACYPLIMVWKFKIDQDQVFWRLQAEILENIELSSFQIAMQLRPEHRTFTLIDSEPAAEAWSADQSNIELILCEYQTMNFDPEIKTIARGTIGRDE